MIDYSTIKSLNIDLTSKCNASCIACDRNYSGYGVKKDLIIADLSIERITEVLNLLPNLDTIWFCGIYGDAIASANINEAIQLLIARDIKKIHIHTNGSLRSVSWWENFGSALKDRDHMVIFGIDGLEDTHSLYRQGTNFKKIIENAVAFINSGGNASWQFIPFAHNEHQILEAKKLSKKLGFKKFNLRRDVRYVSQPKHYKTGEPLNIKPWSHENNIGRYDGEELFGQNLQSFTTVEKSECMHLSLPSLFLTHTGKLTPCCFLPNIKIEHVDIESEIHAKQYRPQCLMFCGK